MLTEHYDRNPEKHLLKGRIGYVHPWQPDDKETSVFNGDARYLQHPHKVVFVKFYEMKKEGKKIIEKPCDWQIDGMSEPGLYPIQPRSRSWHLDQNRTKLRLRASRWQVPLRQLMLVERTQAKDRHFVPPS